MVDTDRAHARETRSRFKCVFDEKSPAFNLDQKFGFEERAPRPPAP